MKTQLKELSVKRKLELARKASSDWNGELCYYAHLKPDDLEVALVTIEALHGDIRTLEREKAATA